MFGVMSRVLYPVGKAFAYPLPAYINKENKSVFGVKNHSHLIAPLSDRNSFHSLQSPEKMSNEKTIVSLDPKQAPREETVMNWYLKKGFRASVVEKEETASFGQKNTQGDLKKIPGNRLANAFGLVSSAISCFSGLNLAFSLSIGASLSTISKFRLSSKNNKHVEAGAIITPSMVEKGGLVPEYNRCSALPTENSADTEIWRRRLISAANHNIIISGNYCGGEVFCELLDLIEKRLGEKQELKVIVISSPIFLTPMNRKKIDFLSQKYPKNFSLIESADYYVGYDEVKKSTNHTKCMVVDFGKYFILGGSGIKSNLTETGLDDLSKKAYFESKGEPFTDIEKKKSFFATLIPILLPKSWRDGDFVFSNPSLNNSGKQVYKQALLLALKYEEQAMVNKRTLSDEELGLFTNAQGSLKDTDSVVVSLLKTPVPKAEDITTWVSDFEKAEQKSEQVAFKLLCVGPHINKSPFAKELILEIHRAETEIVINHMYFHPNDEILQALANAANRGVKIKIITNGSRVVSLTTYGYGSRNKLEYKNLLSFIKDEHKNKVEFFEFNQQHSALHKKTITIDDKVVISGSSNFGLKSLNWSSDDEMNFIARDPVFTKEVNKINTIDMSHSKKIKSLNVSLLETCAFKIHKALSWFWG